VEMEKSFILILREHLDLKEFKRLPKDMDWMDRKLCKISNMPEDIQFNT
jgi:hypothetical protein